jgi:hypothetical protein
MSLQMGLHNRRKFLERSALGAGSLLFAPLLLESCKRDQDLPAPYFPPRILGEEFDWNDDAKIVVTTGLEMIPEVGDILGGLVDIFWPSSKVDVWGEIKAQVEALVDKKILDSVYQQVSEDLQGLNNTLILYLSAIKTGTPSEILTQWQITRTAFTQALPHFQSIDYQLPLLPLFAQFANLYLTILRDGVIAGTSWGRTAADQQQTAIDLTQSIKDFSFYAGNAYGLGRLALSQKVNADPNTCQPFLALNKFDRQMTLTALHYMDTWPYYDVTQYPTGTHVVLTRETYTDPQGDCPFDNGKIDLPPSSYPTQPPTSISIVGESGILGKLYGVQLTYPANSGPNGVTQTPYMGLGSGPIQGILTMSPNNPITYARASYEYPFNVNSLQFKYYDGTITPAYGNGQFIGDSGMMGYNNQFLSSVYIQGIKKSSNGPDGFVFGFQYWQPPAATLNAVRAIYIRSPKERSLADVAKAFPKVANTANLITDELKAARIAYWAYIEARAKKLR